MDSQSNRHSGKGKTRVKSGCRTCKVRKVKCDEEHPICRRCISTGRICDGYGIWGGGGNFYNNRQRRVNQKDLAALRVPISVSLPALGTEEEKGYFEWFRCRTVTKIPGSFISGFWTTLLFQASLNEPAVLHAILALSSVHKDGAISDDDQWVIDSIPKEQEQFTLQHYVKAINCLRPHFTTKTKTSLRVPLITCILFVCLELLRGHFSTAQTHLQNGLKILEEIKMLFHEKDGTLHSKPYREITDDWIVEAFSRLHLQMELFKHTHQHPTIVLRFIDPEISTLGFRTLNEIWQEFERILNNIFHLTYQARLPPIRGCEPPQHSLSLLENQQQIHIELARWLRLYEACGKVWQTRLGTGLNNDEEKVDQLLHAYHTMANIMNDTSLHPNSENIFDSQTDRFVTMITQLTSLSIYSKRPTPILAKPGHTVDMARSIIDMGWIPLLYYVAVKCRVHRVRLHAIKFLETSPHREGIWDAQTAACAARKVMEIEEGDFYSFIDKSRDDFLLSSPPTPQDLSLPILPEEYRLRDVEVVLEGTPMDKILLFCKRNQGGVDGRTLLSKYSVQLQDWIDESYK